MSNIFKILNNKGEFSFTVSLFCGLMAVINPNPMFAILQAGLSGALLFMGLKQMNHYNSCSICQENKD